MKNFLKQMKYGDIIILVFLVLLSFLPVTIFAIQEGNTEVDSYTAVISSNGEAVHEIVLTDDDETETFEYTNSNGQTNIVVREGTSIHMHDADCADQLCVRQGEISTPGETIVCLPHTFLVEITSDSEDIDTDSEIDAIT